MGATDPKDATYYKRVSELFGKRHHSLTMLMRLIATSVDISLKVLLDLRFDYRNHDSSMSLIREEAQSL